MLHHLRAGIMFHARLDACRVESRSSCFGSCGCKTHPCTLTPQHEHDKCTGSAQPAGTLKHAGRSRDGFLLVRVTVADDKAVFAALARPSTGLWSCMLTG